MYRIRFHGRGGQGMKTASRILGTAFFIEGYEVQDAPRYGAERRGAPIFAYVRADRSPIQERGIISHPDLVVVADDSLVAIPAAGVLGGITDGTVFLINSTEDSAVWQDRLNHKGAVLALPVSAEVTERVDLPYIGAACAGAAARLTGVISEASLVAAIRQELVSLEEGKVSKNIDNAVAAFHAMDVHAGQVSESDESRFEEYKEPDWVELPFELARLSAPVIQAAATSTLVRTGLWRTQRPVIDYALCKGCWWVCSSYCPDGAINVVDNKPEIDYEHCKGCMVCVAQCPPHAIQAIPEKLAQRQEQAEKSGEVGP
jgi:pyruvate ferredoxin oxidoreductase gamma subunit